MSWVYIKTEASLWTVGFYDLDGKYQTDSDHDNRKNAASRAAFLNGHTRERSLREPRLLTFNSGEVSISTQNDLLECLASDLFSNYIDRNAHDLQGMNRLLSEISDAAQAFYVPEEYDE